MLQISRPCEGFWSCGSIPQGITEEVKKQGQQPINNRSTMTVLGIHNLAYKNTQRGRRYGNSAESQKLKNANDYLGSAKKHNYGTIVERSRAVPSAHARTRTRAIRHGRFDRIANERRIYVAAHCRNQYKVVQPYQGGSDTAKTEEHSGYKQFVQWTGEP